jgi:LysR family tcuABC transcriptional regulator
MELRQLRYFVRIVELGSMGRAALDLDMVQSALSQQISRLESELSTRLLQRTAKGAVPTEAGLAFLQRGATGPAPCRPGRAGGGAGRGCRAA